MFRFFLVFWSSTSSAATRYRLQTTEPKVPICIICCRHARNARADSHDGCTHVIRLKVDRKNTPLRKPEFADPTDRESGVLKLLSVYPHYEKDTHLRAKKSIASMIRFERNYYYECTFVTHSPIIYTVMWNYKLSKDLLYYLLEVKEK